MLFEVWGPSCTTADRVTSSYSRGQLRDDWRYFAIGTSNPYGVLRTWEANCLIENHFLPSDIFWFAGHAVTVCLSERFWILLLWFDAADTNSAACQPYEAASDTTVRKTIAISTWMTFNVWPTHLEWIRTCDDRCWCHYCCCCCWSTVANR